MITRWTCASLISLVLAGSALADDEFTASRHMLEHVTGGQINWMVSFDRFEVQSSDDSDMGVVEGDFWVGGDLNKFWLKIEGEFDLEDSGDYEASLEALYSRAITPFFDLQTGLRQDVTSGDDQSYLVVGLRGHAPYWIGLDTALNLSEEGNLSARFEAEGDILLTQRLILQPRFETHWASEDQLDELKGSGLTDASFGLRLRYDISRQFSPYLGIASEWVLGETADLVKDLGGDTQETSLVVGIKFWF